MKTQFPLIAMAALFCLVQLPAGAGESQETSKSKLEEVTTSAKRPQVIRIDVSKKLRKDAPIEEQIGMLKREVLIAVKKGSMTQEDGDKLMNKLDDMQTQVQQYEFIREQQRRMIGSLGPIIL